jgi:hypothetical protein
MNGSLPNNPRKEDEVTDEEKEKSDDCESALLLDP